MNIEQKDFVDGLLQGIRVIVAEEVGKQLEEKLAPIEARLTALEERLTIVEEHLARHDEKLAAIEEHLTPHDEMLAKHDEKLAAIEEHLSHHDEMLTKHDEKLAAIEEHLACHDEQLAKITGDNASIVSRLRHIELILENEFKPKLDEIYSCYLDTYKRYQEKTETIGEIEVDIRLLKITAEDHSRRLKAAGL